MLQPVSTQGSDSINHPPVSGSPLRPRPLPWTRGRCILAGGAILTALAVLTGAECAETPLTYEQPDVTPKALGYETQVTIETSVGDIVIELFPDQAPQCVGLFLSHVADGYYDGSIIHKSTSAAITGGIYTEDLTEKESRSLANESQNGLSNKRGYVALYGPDDETTGLPFIRINLASNTGEDYDLVDDTAAESTVIGRVIDGIDVADEIAGYETSDETTESDVDLNNVPIIVNDEDTDDDDEFVIIQRVYISDDEGNPSSHPPTADAGSDQTVTVGTTITLDGTASRDPDPDDNIHRYQWTQTVGPEMTLSDATSATPTFVCDEVTRLVFELTVGDRAGRTNTDTVNIVVSSDDNQPPIADAGVDQIVTIETEVTIDGSASSDPDGDTLTYKWEQLSGTEIELLRPKAASTSFTAPEDANEVVLQLTVSDGQGGTATDTLTIRVVDVDPVTADAGEDQDVVIGNAVVLTGQATEFEGSKLTYAWTQVSGTATIELSYPNTLTPYFTAPDTADELVFEFTATNAAGNTTTDTVTITVFEHQPPTADAGEDQAVVPGTEVTLEGTATDPQDLSVTYSWAQTSGETVTLENADTAIATFTAPDTVGDLEFELTVENSIGDTVTDTVIVSVQEIVADAGEDQNVVAGDTVELEGSVTAPDGTTLTYAWTQTSGSTVTLTDADTATPTFEAPADESGQIVLQLTVTAEGGDSDTDTVTITNFIETDSGLMYADIVIGGGDIIEADSEITCYYVGRYDDQNGEIFDETEDDESATFNLDELIQGWQEGIGQYDMRIGGKRQLILTSELGYDDGEIRWFEIEVIDADPP